MRTLPKYQVYPSGKGGSSIKGEQYLMSGIDDVLQHVGEIERCIIEEEGTRHNPEALSIIGEALNKILQRHGWYRYVSEMCAAIKYKSNKLYSSGNKHIELIQELKIAILKDCIALRRYVVRIKT